MASLEEAQSHLTTCPICFEYYETPRYLSCKHCFCEGCLHTYIVSTFESESSAFGIHCPVCRYFFEKPKTIRLEEWASTLPSDDGFKTRACVLELEQNEAGLPISELCSACEREKKSSVANWWCKDCDEAFCDLCERQHRKFKSSCRHTVVPRELYVVHSKENRMERQKTETHCASHREMKLEAYCYDHDCLCCFLCVLFHHRKCEKIVTAIMARNQKRDDLIKSFEVMKLKLHRLHDGRKKNLTSFVKASLEMKVRIENEAVEYIRIISDVKEKTLQNIKALDKEVEQSIKLQSQEVKCRLSSVVSSLNFLHSEFPETASLVQQLKELEDLNYKLEEIQEYISSKLYSWKTHAIRYEDDENLSDLIGKLQVLGSLGRIRLEEKASAKNYMKEIDVMDIVTGVEFLIDGRLLISKLNSQELQLWDKGFSRIIHSRPLSGKPWGVKMISHTEGGVILGGKGLLLFKITHNKTLSIFNKTAGTIHSCHDFAFDGKYFYIGSKKAIQVYDRDLNYLYGIDVKGCVKYITLQGDDFFFVTKFGDDRMQHSGPKDTSDIRGLLKGLNGVDSDTDGNIFACVSHRKSVLRIDYDGVNYTDVVTDLPEVPLSIALNMEQDKMALGCTGKVIVLAIF